MKNTLTAGAALLLSTSIATAGGIDRSGSAYSILFEEGNYAQLSFSSVTPEVSGDYAAPLGGGSTENMAKSYITLGGALKYGVTEEIDLALFINQPYGANAEYTDGPYTGLEADWASTQVAALAKYQATAAVSVYGGIRAIQSEATISIPATLTGAVPYEAETESNTQIGYVLGAAYEMPEIALRVALTYESGVTHDFDISEDFVGAPFQADGSTDIEMPQSVALDFQTGGAANIYDDVSVFARVTYEEGSGDEASRLAPTDGSTSIGLGGSYNLDDIEISGGIEYALLGDATDGSDTEFKDNTALGLGINVGFSF